MTCPFAKFINQLDEGYNILNYVENFGMDTMYSGHNYKIEKYDYDILNR